MPIAVACPACGVKLKAPDAAVGKTLKCPKCALSISVPGAAAEGSTRPHGEVSPTNPPRTSDLAPSPPPTPYPSSHALPTQGVEERHVASGVSNGFAIGGLAIGILALVLAIIPCFGALAIYPGIVAVLLSAVALAISLASKSKVSGMAISALVVSILSVAIGAFWIHSMNQAARDLERAGQELQRELQKNNQER